MRLLQLISQLHLRQTIYLLPARFTSCWVLVDIQPGNLSRATGLSQGLAV